MMYKCYSVKEKMPEREDFYFGFSYRGGIPCILFYDKDLNEFQVVGATIGKEGMKPSHWIDAPLNAGKWIKEQNKSEEVPVHVPSPEEIKKAKEKETKTVLQGLINRSMEALKPLYKKIIK